MARDQTSEPLHTRAMAPLTQLSQMCISQLLRFDQSDKQKESSGKSMGSKGLWCGHLALNLTLCSHSLMEPEH